MPNLKIADEQGKELLSTSLPGDGLGKYLKAAASLRSLVPIATVFSRPLSEAAGAREVALTVDRDIPVGKNSELAIGVGASVKIGLHEAGSEILAGTDLQSPVSVPNGTAFTSLTLESQLKAGLSSTAGSLGFGFEAGTGLRYAYFHPFDVVGTGPVVGDAVKTMLGAAVFPADADDLARLPVGAFVSLAGEGELSFSAEAAVGSATTLLATPGLPIVGSAAIGAGANVKIGARVDGERRVRAARLEAGRIDAATGVLPPARPFVGGVGQGAAPGSKPASGARTCSRR